MIRAEEASSVDKDTYKMVRKEFAYHLEKMPGVYTSDLMLRQSLAEERDYVEVVDERQIAWLSGWVGSQISVGRNKRLASALKCMGTYGLEDKSGSPSSTTLQDRLMRELPAITLVELGDFQQDPTRLSKLKSRVARHLEKGENPSDYLQRKGELAADDPSDAPMDELMLEEFFLKEQINALKISAKLSKREDQVLKLVLEGRLEREIASELGMVEGTVKTYKSRVRQKLQKAAGE